MKEFVALFKKVGGAEVLRQYRAGHVLLFALFQTIFQGFSKKSLEIVRLSVNNRLLKKLRKKYRRELATWQTPQLEHVRSRKVWVCWLQGMERAPAVVRRCYRSLRENLHDREIVLLTEKNYREYVQFPEFIQKKIDSGVISAAHMSDLLRLELLIRYGGTWIDATVLCTDGNCPAYMLDSDLFFFQTLKPGLDGHATCMSNWFLTACTNNPVLMLTRHLLYTFWEKNNHVPDYFVFHDFFQLVLEKYPEQWARVVPFSNAVPHMLLLRLFQPYDAASWEAICDQTPFHKLTYKFDTDSAMQPNTYYARLMGADTQEVS